MVVDTRARSPIRRGVGRYESACNLVVARRSGFVSLSGKVH
jgi:hypothetical protein